MEHSSKMVLTPFENEPAPPILMPSTNNSVQYNSTVPVQTTSTGTQSYVQNSNMGTQISIRKQKSHPFLEKLINQLKIILKLAKIDAYDTSLRIKNNKGDFIENSHIINLLQNATVLAKVLIGQDDFIKLLFQAKVEPELIANENVRTNLIKLYEKNNSNDNKPVEPMIFSDVSSHEPVDPTVNIRAKKRRREENDFDENESEDEPPSKKSWIYPNETENLDD
jgi:hypothetical protein